MSGLKTVVHLYNGILHNRKKEGAPTLCDSMDGTAEHIAKWKKPGSERQIPYDLTYKWNLINKINKQAKYNQRHENKEPTYSDQRGGRRGIMGERRGRGRVKEHVWRTHGNGQWGDWIREWGVGAGESNGRKIGTTVIEQQYKIIIPILLIEISSLISI